MASIKEAPNATLMNWGLHLICTTTELSRVSPRSRLLMTNATLDGALDYITQLWVDFSGRKVIGDAGEPLVPQRVTLSANPLIQSG